MKMQPVIATLGLVLAANFVNAAGTAKTAAPKAKAKASSNKGFVNLPERGPIIQFRPTDGDDARPANPSLDTRPTVVLINNGQTCHDINQAIQGLHGSGGVVSIAAGTYVCTEPIIINRDNVKVIGAGRKQTLIKAANATPLPLVVIGSVINVMNPKTKSPHPNFMVQNISLSRMTIDGNYQSHQWAKNPARDTTKPRIDDVECFDPRNGVSQNCGTDSGHFIRNNALTIRRAEHVRVSDIETRGAYSGGITLEKGNRDVLMDNFSSSLNYFDGFAGYDTTESHFTNMNVSNNQYSGISLDWGFEWNSLSNVIAENNGDNGIFSQHVGHNTLENMRLANNKNLGIYLAGGFDEHEKPEAGTCDGVTIRNVVSIGPKFGVYVNGICKDIVLDKVRVLQPEMQCLWFMDGSDVKVGNSTCSNVEQSQKL